MIRKLIFTLICFLVLTGTACSRPFLICDPLPGVLEYEVLIEGSDGIWKNEIVLAEADTTLRFDLVGIPYGTYNAKIKNRTHWGWADWSTSLGFIVEICSPSTGLTIIP